MQLGSQASRLTCSGSHRVANVCVNIRCSQQPFLCADDLCDCRSFHRRHRTVDVRRLIDKLNEPLQGSEEVTGARKSMLEVIDSAISALQLLRRNHEEFAEDHVWRNFRWGKARERLLAMDSSYPFSGDLLYKMLRELEASEGGELPYTVDR